MGFASIHLSKKNVFSGAVFCFISGILQLAVLLLFEENMVWKIYSLITHFPLLLFLMLIYRKSFSVCLSSITSAYLCCQPAKWLGLVTYSVSSSITANYLIRILTLVVSAVVVTLWFRPVLAEIFASKDKSALYFAAVPVIYYLFDYIIGPYIEQWNPYMQIAVEFLPFFICVLFLIFSSMYYREHQLKMQAERKEQIIQIASDQQKRELDLMKAKTHELRLLRHDMRLLMNQLALSIQNDDKQTSLKIISDFVEEIDSTVIRQYCENEPLNYVLSSYAHKCEALKIQLKTDVKLESFELDDNMFCSIVLNALDNALNAVKDLPESERIIHLLLKNSGGKILFSIKNLYQHAPEFVDGIPVTHEKGHGFGTQSICYLTERLKGKYQFSLKDNWFVLRVII